MYLGNVEIIVALRVILINKFQLLTTEDLIEMSNIKENQEDPAEFLLEKLDNILMELEK